MGTPLRKIVRTVFGRVAPQPLAVVALGGLIALPALWDGVVDEGSRSLVIVSTLLLVAGLAACLVPTWRALYVQPAAAMKTG